MAAQPPVFAAGPAPSQEALRAAQDRLMSARGDLQFSFDAAPKPPPPTTLPHWLEAILRAIGQFIAWIGQGLGWVFVAGLAIALLIVLAFIVREFINARWPDLLKKKAKPKLAPVDWRPTEAVARALLDEADKLAAAGRYAEAARLLLHRSIEEIEGRRPRLVRPALTSREISGLPDIPEAARTTFAAIAAVVERSFFGGRDVDAAGFAECRRTYEAFAFPGAWA
ncbi:MAG TPA: hypothetical protein VKQ70_06635 [Caulobacteraceae bacterium]|nr:hypothetical protein [Caulobacteraceae bacterium]